MQFTRRYWATAAVVGLLAVWAAVLARPLLLVGAAGVAAWLLLYQYRFVRTTGETVTRLAVDLQVDRTRVTARERTSGLLAVDIDSPTELTVRVSAAAPVGARSDGAVCHLGPGDRDSQAGFEVAWPVAGQFAFERPRSPSATHWGCSPKRRRWGRPRR